MRAEIVSIAARVPSWVREGFEDYAQRLGSGLTLRCVDLPLARRGRGGPSARGLEEEGERLLAGAGKNARLIALDRCGSMWSSEELARQLELWRRDGRALCFLVGGPDGLAPICLARAEARWSLGALTLPHALVRILIAEQLYRAQCILAGHPYHR